MTLSQIVTIAAAAGLVLLYVCRMGAHDMLRHGRALGLAHYTGFGAALLAGYGAWQAGAPQPLHLVALLSSAAWLAATYRQARTEAAPSGLHIDPLGR